MLDAGYWMLVSGCWMLDIPPWQDWFLVSDIYLSAPSPLASFL